MRELRNHVAEGRRLISHGERPVYHVITSYDGAAVDVRIRELPTIHLFVPDESGVLEGAPRLDREDPWGRANNLRGRAWV